MGAIPGLPAVHRIVSDECRKRGNHTVVAECVDSVERALNMVLQGNLEGRGTKFHVVVTVEHATQAKEQK